MTAASPPRPRPHLVAEAKHDAHPFEESKHPRDRHGRFISIGAHIDLGNGVTGQVVSAAKNVVTVKKDGGGYTAVHGSDLKKVSVTDAPDPGKPSAHVRGVSPAAPKAAPGDANALLREGLPGFGDYLAWQRIDTGEPDDVRQARMDAAKVAKFQTVADLSDRMASLPDKDLLGEADANLIQRVQDGTSVYLRKPSMYAKGGLKEGPIPGVYDYIEMDKQRFDSMVKEHGPPSGIEQVDMEGFRAQKRRDAIQNMLDIWSTTSNDGDPHALGLQEVATDVFGLEGTVDWPPATVDEILRGQIDDVLKTARPRFESFLRAQHAATQEFFAKAGITEVPVYRGVHVPASKPPDWVESGKVPLRPLSSFSLDRATAATFGYVDPGSRLTSGHLMTGTIPVSRILSTPRTGLGAMEEGEVVVLGGTTSWDMARITPDDMPVSQITTRTEMAAAISTASTPARQAALTARARRFGYLDLIPGEWDTKAAPAPAIDTWPNDHNEDWIKSLSWDVRTSSGDPVDTLVEFARITGKDLKAAAKRVLNGPSAKVAPANLVAEARAALDGEEFPAEPWPPEIAAAASQGRKASPDATLHPVQTFPRPRPALVVAEGKAAHRFNPAKHPRDDHGRWAHTPGGKRVKIPKGYRVGGQAEILKPDFSREGFAAGLPNKWHRGTITDIRARDDGLFDVQLQMHEDGRPHAELVGSRGGNNRIRPVAEDVTSGPQVGPLPLLPDRGRKDGTGTLDDPIDVGDDLPRAAQLLAEGKHIRLSQPEQVSTLLDKLRQVVEDAVSKGEKAPVYDLCKVSVPGTNLFCKQSKNIPRAQMPQLKGEIVPGSPAEKFRNAKGRGDIAQPFRDALAAMGIPITRRTVPASHLRASQSELSGIGVASMLQGMDAGLVPEGTIFVSRDNYIIDGHHRWAAKVAIDTRDGRLGDVPMDVEVVDLDIGAAIDYANAFARVMGIRSKGHGVTSQPTGESKGRPRPYLIVGATLPVVPNPTPSAHEVLQRVLEDKGIRGAWESAKHPRDRHGRFISIGDPIDLGNGQGGHVTHISGRGITVQKDDGSHVTLKGDALKKVDVGPQANISRTTGGGDRRNPAASRAAREAGLSPQERIAQGYLNDVAGRPQSSRPGPADAQREADTLRARTGGGPPAPLNDLQYAQHTQMIEAATKHALDSGMSTDAQYTLDGKGQVWQPDRARQHKEIVDELWAKAENVPSDGKAIIAGGLGGAGKSTVLGKYANIPQGDFLTVNPDDIKEAMAGRGMVPNVPGLSPLEAATLVHEESSHVANMLAQRAYAERKNMIWDITMSSRGSVEKRIQQLRGNGYDDIQAVFVDIPVETSVQRALGRHRRGMEQHRAGQGLGGRYVPPNIIRQNSDAKWSSANRGVFEALKGEFDNWQVWDSSGDTGPKLISSSGGDTPAAAAALTRDALRVSGGVEPNAA